MEILEEEKALLELIEVENLQFFGDHPINAVSIAGVLPNDKTDMIETLRYVIESANEE